jgi:cell division protein FtsB
VYLLAFTASALLANAVLGERGAIEILRARREHRALAVSISSIRSENARLRTEARLLRSDRRTIEAAARRDLGLAARGEHIVLVVTR